MFNQIQKRLTLLYAITFFLFLLAVLLILYFSLTKLMDVQQLNELETYFEKQQHDLFEHGEDGMDKELITYEPNRLYFYYTYDRKRKLIHGDETFEGFYKLVGDVFKDESASISSVHKVEWNENYFILLKKPIVLADDVKGYIVLGKSITDQHHFSQNILTVFIAMTVAFTLIIAVLSYFLAGRAMVPIKKSFDKQKKFVSDASHELRTPLSIFYSSVELIESDRDNELSPFSKELIHDLKDESKLMEDLITELLFLARHDQQQVQLTLNEFQLSDLLEEIQQKFSRTVPSDQIVIKTDIQHGVKITGDLNRIKELLYILLDNALQYTKEGHICLALKTAGSKVLITVEDTGCGIQGETLPLIFDRFYRGDSSRKRTGTGLGLSIAQTIVEQHRGKISVTSEVGKGSCFTVELPMRQT